MKLDEPVAGDTPPRRDRIILASLLLLVAALAWAFTLHQTILMDEMEAAMWRDMNMSMNDMAAVVERDRCRDAICDVVGDDGGNDDTRCKSDDHRICDNQSPTASTRCTLRANSCLSTRLPHRMGRIFSHRDSAPVVATEPRPSHYNDAVFVLLLVSCAFWRSRALSTQPLEGNVPCSLPFTRRFCPD